MSLKLYEIPSMMQALEDELIEAQGELTPELEARFDAFLKGGPDKIEAGAMVLRGLEMEAKSCKEEAKRLSERAVSLENNADRLKKLVLWALDGGFGGKCRTLLFTIWGQTSAAVKNIDVAPGVNLKDLPEAFVRVSYSLAKDAVKDALKRGETIPDEIIVSEVPGTRFLRIK